MMALLVLLLTACGGGDIAEPEPFLIHEERTLVRGASIDLDIPPLDGALLIEVLPFEANVESQVVDRAGMVIRHVGFEYLRAIPLYHVLPPGPEREGARLRLITTQASARARAAVRFHHLPDDTRAQRTLRSAWETLARGQQRVDTLEASPWRANQEALGSAGRSFEALGLQRLALWCRYLEAYVRYFPLYEYGEAAAAAERLLEELSEHGNTGSTPAWATHLQVLSHQLAGQILLESDGDIRPEGAPSPLARARDHFNQARALADSADLSFESIWAINNLGIAHFYAENLEPSLEAYHQALGRAAATGDSYLEYLIGSNVAVAEERAGHIDRAVETLERLLHDPKLAATPLERENLLAGLGNYYSKLYRFPEALEALNEALRLSEETRSSETLGRNRLALGRVYREMGQADKARAFAEAALDHLEAAQDWRSLRQAYRLLADVHRLKGDWAAMADARTREASHLDTPLDRAEWQYARAGDALAEGRNQDAATGYAAASDLYRDAGAPSWSDLATLASCAAAIGGEAPADCQTARLRERFAGVQSMRASAPAMQGRATWIRLLAAAGETEAAKSEALGLIAEMQFYRRSLPGVLGAWYWDARREVFDDYLQMMLASGAPTLPGRPETLLALDRLRNASSTGPDGLSAEPGGDTEPMAESFAAADLSDEELEAIRVLLSQRDLANDTEEQMRTQRLIDRRLANRRPELQTGAGLEPEELLEQLKDLPPGWTLVAFYLAGTEALSWVGRPEGLTLVRLGPSEPILQRIERVRAGLTIYNPAGLETDLAALGADLFGPLIGALGENVLVAGGGALSDLPLEALTIDGAPLIERYRFLNVRSLGNAGRLAHEVEAGIRPESLFLAGAPRAATAVNLPGTEHELEAVQTAFPTVEAHVRTQDDLAAAAFRDEPFRSADLIHIASHAVIDRDYPELSRLILSDGRGGNPEFLTPADLSGDRLSARLIVLSACETVGLNRFDFDTHLGFVTVLLQRSDALVVASLWPVPDQATSRFMTHFYRELAASGEVPEALRSAKLQLRRDSGPGNRTWSAFQLFGG